MTLPPPAATYDTLLGDAPQKGAAITPEKAQQVFTYFQQSPLFRWTDANNDCEDRANAICILLDAWGVVNYKAWVFSGYFRKKNYGSLINYWNYHVAAAVPVWHEGEIAVLVIDPSLAVYPVTIHDWALGLTESGTSFYFTKPGSLYIFPGGKIESGNWHKRNKRNLNWTMQGLSGINGVSATGKAQLVFNKARVAQIAKRFAALKTSASPF